MSAAVSQIHYRSFPASAPKSLEHPWYAVRVRSNCERTVSEILREKGFAEFSPFYVARRRWSDRIKRVQLPLFPGYMFCRFDPVNRLPLLQTPGVVNIVGFGQNFIPVDEHEIEAIRAIMTSGNEVQPWHYLRAGQKVRVRSGSLAGVEGVLVKIKNTRRLVVSIDLLQRSVAAELDRVDIEPRF